MSVAPRTPRAGPDPGGANAVAVVACMLAGVASWPALAGRPLDTDDAAVIPRGSCQGESFARRVGAAADVGRRSDFAFAPSCNPFGWSEWLIGAERDGVGQPGAVTAPVLAIKAVPLQVSRTRPGVGLSATIAETFVRGQTRPAGRFGALNAIASVPIATNGQIDANAGWSHDWAPAANSARDHTTWGVAGEWAASRALTLVAERTGATRQGFRSQVGVAWSVSPRITLDAALGRRHQPDDRAPYLTIGITVVSAGAATTATTPASPSVPASDLPEPLPPSLVTPSSLPD